MHVASMRIDRPVNHEFGVACYSTYMAGLLSWGLINFCVLFESTVERWRWSGQSGPEPGNLW